MKRRFTIGLVAVLLAVFAAYSNSSGNAFHCDDFHTVVDNPATRSLSNVPQFFVDAGTSIAHRKLGVRQAGRRVVKHSVRIECRLGSFPDKDARKEQG